MPDDDVQSRLDRISTQWTMVFQAHGLASSAAGPARIELVQRYRGAVYRYLLAVVRNEDLAEELCQQFVLKFLEGEFHKANPERGRFRDYVKTALVNLVRRHYRTNANAPGSLPSDLPDAAKDPQPDDSEDEYTRQWWADVMDLTWNALAAEHRVYHDLLRLRVDEPGLTSRELAEQYTAKFSKPISSANVRKTLERAHGKFADLMVREVASSLAHPDHDSLRAELKELDLLKYCRTAVDAWTPPGAK